MTASVYSDDEAFTAAMVAQFVQIQYPFELIKHLCYYNGGAGRVSTTVDESQKLTGFYSSNKV